MAPIDIRKRIVAPFAIGEEFFIDRAGNELLMQFIEAREMIERSLGSILASRAASHEKRPVARLREQKFARELFQNTFVQRLGNLTV